MILKRLALVAAAAIAFTASAASADSRYWSNSGWAVFDYTDDSRAWCGLMTEDRGNGASSLRTHIALTQDGDVVMVVENDDWNITTPEVSGMSLFLYDTSGRKRNALYDGGVWERSDRNSFLVMINPDFLPLYASSNYMFIFRDMGNGEDDAMVGMVDLTGSGYAVGKLRECVATAARNLRDKRERERTQPVNPF